MIGIFDSGLGGLVIAKEILHQVPEYQICYLGDTARLPYGSRSSELLYQFSIEAVEYLFQQGCPLVVVACNSVSAEALRRLQQEWLPAHYPDRKVLGVIRPTAEAAVEISKSGRIGVIGTRGTVQSGAYERELTHLRSDVTVTAQACPLLVPLVEEGWIDRPVTYKVLRAYLRPLKQHHIDTLILGCTHYPFLLKHIRRICGRRITVFNPAESIARKLREYLERHTEVETRLTRGDAHRFMVTDVTPTFQSNAERWLGRKITLESCTLPLK